MTAQDPDPQTLECAKLYNEAFEQFSGSGLSENDAQRNAISKSFEDAIKTYGITNSAQLWQAIQSAHVARKSGAFIPAKVISDVISASQSWNKSSGHAFEESFCKLANENLVGENLTFFLQRELSLKISQDKIDNHPRDIERFREWIESSAFDVYVGLEVSGKTTVFGCVQCKTSIRDRVTRDREPSLLAMNEFFWSIAVVANGDFLNLPKFKAMVNGNTADYANNGWHGMYVYSGCPDDGRIFLLNQSFAPLVDHAKSAAQNWQNQRQWINLNWHP